MAPPIADKLYFGFSASDRYSGRMSTGLSSVNTDIPSYMFLVDFSLNYKKTTNSGYSGSTTAYTYLQMTHLLQISFLFVL